VADQRAQTALRTVVFDTDVLIWHFRGRASADRFLSRVPRTSRAISMLSLLELLQGCRSRAELREVHGFVAANLGHVIVPNEPISHRAMLLLEMHAASHGLRVIDAMIAGTALVVGAALATANVRHYRSIRELPLLAFRP